MEPTKPPEPTKAIVRDNTPVGQLMESVAHQRVKLERLLPTWMSVDRFITQVRLALTVGDPYKLKKLQECDPKSVVNAVLTAAELGLDPSGRLGSAYLVPYGTECQLIPGYRGLIDLAVRSGFVKSINAWVVHQEDSFTVVNGKLPRHVPFMPKFGEPADAGPVYAAWCRSQLRGGGVEATVMTRAEIERIKDRSAAVRYARQNPTNSKAQQSPWFTDEEAMQMKTVVRRHVKLLPLSPTAGLNTELERFSKAIDLDDSEDADFAQAVPSEPPETKQSKTEQLKKDL